MLFFKISVPILQIPQRALAVFLSAGTENSDVYKENAQLLHRAFPSLHQNMRTDRSYTLRNCGMYLSFCQSLWSP